MIDRLSLVVALAIMAVGALLTISSPGRPSNCGGNSAALTYVGEYVMIAQMAADESADGQFRISQATPEQQEMLISIVDNGWTGSARYLVDTRPFRSSSAQQRQLVCVCDRPYTNVPQRTFGKAPPTHAAAYSDGSTQLLSVAQFAALDRSALKPLDQLLPPSTSRP